jgi:hypothetical protein
MIKVTIELDEEQLRELFEEREIKFSKKKVKEIQEQLNEDFSELEERLGELVDEIIVDNYEK